MWIRKQNPSHSPGLLYGNAGRRRVLRQGGSFEEGYDFDAVVLDDTSLVHPQELTVTERLERAVYPGLDRNGIRAKFAAGEQIAL